LELAKCGDGVIDTLCPDARLWLLDGKRVELGLWREIADVFVGQPDHDIGAFAAPTATIDMARNATCAAFVLFFTHGIASRPSGLTDWPCVNRGGFSTATVTLIVSAPVSSIATSWTTWNGRPVPFSVFCTPFWSVRGANGRPLWTYPHHSDAARALGALWRWRVELLCVITLTVVWVWIAYQIPESWPRWTVPVILVALIVVIAVVPVSRRFVIRRVWCVFSRHRVRKCFVQSRVMTHEGLLPLFMWTRPTPVGDRLWLWLRPGLSGRDIEAVADRIAAACVQMSDQADRPFTAPHRGDML
jgi:hypothetical protein